MHPNLLHCLTVLAVARLLTLAALPAPAPVRLAPAEHAGRAGRAAEFDPLVVRVTDTRPPRPRPAAVGFSAPSRPAPPHAAAADLDRPPAAHRGAARPTRRGVRSRRRGSRGGRLWRTGERPDQLYIAQLNVQSVKPKLLELRNDIARHNYDVIVLCETWLKPTTPDRLIPIPGYQLLRRDRADGKGYGGVAVLVREGRVATVLDGPDRVTADSRLESLWVQIGTGPQRVVICSLYRPPVQTQARVTADLDTLEQQLQHHITRHSGPIVIAGDIDINTGDGGNTSATGLREMLAAYAVQQHIDSATFRSSGSTIDVIATNRGVERAGTMHCHYSPHNY